MSLFSWLKKESASEKLVAKALVEFAEGDSKNALGDMIQGLIGLAAGTKAENVLYNIQTRLANVALVPPPPPRATVAQVTLATPAKPVAAPAPVTPTATK